MSDDERVLRAFLTLLDAADERDRARVDVAFLMSFMSAPDERTGDSFTFAHLREPLGPGEIVVDGNQVVPRDRSWRWQRAEVDAFEGAQRHIRLKARQLGETWVCCAYVMASALVKAGSLSLVYRQKEEEAIENVRRCWSLFQSLPEHLRMDVQVVTPDPSRSALPSTEIKLRFPDGKYSRIVAMTSATASGHGKTASVILLDEFSRIDNAAEIMKAVQPAAGSKGKILIISTANGVSDPETGAGNKFHDLWENAEDAGFQKRFLAWSLHPDRDQHWYDTDPEIRGLRPHERAEQYPSDELEAFTLTNQTFFAPDDLEFYREKVRQPEGRFDFKSPEGNPRSARLVQSSAGSIRIYERPVKDHLYAIGADVSTGRGRDYSAAYVIDLTSMQFVAEFHGRLGQDLYAHQLHFLGRYYGKSSGCTNDAWLAVETQGGFGEAVIIALRDGVKGRPAYPNLYRHVLDARPDKPIAKPFGWPTNQKTRPKIFNQFEQAIRDRLLEWVTPNLAKEMRTLIRYESGPTPAAQKGSRDDCTVAAAITLELYRQRGTHAARPKRSRNAHKEPAMSRPWQKGKESRIDDARYRSEAA